MLTPAAKENKFRIGYWLMLAEYGEAARRNMIVGWVCAAMLALVEAIWLPRSSMSFDPAIWPALAHSCLWGAAALTFYLVISYRLRHAQDRFGRYLRAALERFSLLFRSCLLIAAIGSVGLIFSYLATAAALPMKDAFLARLDSLLGFHWLSFWARPTIILCWPTYWSMPIRPPRP